MQITAMDRRAALAWLGSSLLCACGGGSSGPAAAPTAAPTAEPISAAPAAAPLRYSPNIALWGDSMIPPVAVNLRQLMPDRQVFDGGVIGERSDQIAARAVADAAHRDWINVYWYGHNNQDQPQRIKADIAASIANLPSGHQRFIVMALVNQAEPREMRGGDLYELILQHNRDLAALYGERYLDIRSHLVSRYNSAFAQDVTDHGNDVPPWSLRHDEIHLNNDGSIVVAEKLREFILARGW